MMNLLFDKQLETQDQFRSNRLRTLVFVPLTSLEERRASCVITIELARSSAQVSVFGELERLGRWMSSFTISQITNATTHHSIPLFLGAFGEVRMCVHRESGAQRAVKVLRKSHMDDDEKRMLFNEINILKEIVSAVNICIMIKSAFLAYFF